MSLLRSLPLRRSLGCYRAVTLCPHGSGHRRRRDKRFAAKFTKLRARIARPTTTRPRFVSAGLKRNGWGGRHWARLHRGDRGRRYGTRSIGRIYVRSKDTRSWRLCRLRRRCLRSGVWGLHARLKSMPASLAEHESDGILGSTLRAIHGWESRRPLHLSQEVFRTDRDLPPRSQSRGAIRGHVLGETRIRL